MELTENVCLAQELLECTSQLADPGSYHEDGRNWFFLWMGIRTSNQRVLGRISISDNLPPATIITLPGKMIAINSLSGTGICGGNDFWRSRFKEDGLSAEKAGGHQVEKRRYAVENKTRSTPGKVHNYSR